MRSRSVVRKAFVVFAVLCATRVTTGEHTGLTSMPADIPADPNQYLSKWDPFEIQAVRGAKETLSRNNGRQIARDAAGRCLLLIEKDRQSLWLAVAAGPRDVGGNAQSVELLGPGSEAVFNASGEILGGSMVVDREDRLHVVWTQDGKLFHASRSVKDVAIEQLREKSGWDGPTMLADAPCEAGDILLDAAGTPLVCYCTNDAVHLRSLADGKDEIAVRPEHLPVLVGSPQAAEEAKKHFDPAAPPPPSNEPSWPPPRPLQERQCHEAGMDVGPDGSIHLVFQRDFDIWYARRAPDGSWEAPEKAAWGLAFHPTIIVAGDRPLICFQLEGIRKLQLGSEEYLTRREGGGASIGFAVKQPAGWRTDYLAKTEEIVVNRQRIWEERFKGQLLAMLEEMWRPVLFRDPRGVVWALWQNTTRRWAFTARWLGDGFGEIQECRGPFCAPGEPISAEKIAPDLAPDVGLMFFAGNRVMFDRLKIPSLSLTENREVLFFDSLEVAQTSGLDFVVNPMTKCPANPIFTPGPFGTKDDRRVQGGHVRKHGKTYVMQYGYQSWGVSGWYMDGLAISDDGIHWQRVNRLPDDLPPPDSDGQPVNPVARGYFDNPDTSDPAKRYLRVGDIGKVWHQGSKRVLYSADGEHWTDGPEISVLNAIYEGGTPNLWDPDDLPERRIKVYGRVYSTNSRSCGMMWTADMLHWRGVEHYLDPDDPYGKPPLTTRIGPLRGQIFMDACAGKGEDQIYTGDVHRVDGLYMCFYWICSSEHRIDGALAVSRDGYNFTRVKNGSRTLPVGPAGAWDSGMAQLALPMRDGDELRLYYGGSGWHHGVEPYLPCTQIGLATIRVNGWTYYAPMPETGQGVLTTIPIDAPADQRKTLAVNVEGLAASPSALRVEVLDASSGQPLPGFAAVDCIAPTTDGVAVPVAWKNSPVIPTGKPIRLCFALAGRNTRLYSFAFKPATP